MFRIFNLWIRSLGRRNFPSFDYSPPGLSPWAWSLALKVSLLSLACAFSRWVNSLAIMALLVLRSSRMSKSGCVDSAALSISRFRILVVILWYVFLLWLWAIFLVSVLKVSHSICGFVMFWSTLLALYSFMSFWSWIPRFIIFSIVFWSSIRVSGHDQRPFPVYGASFGAYFS
jgi:hypothetical protein